MSLFLLTRFSDVDDIAVVHERIITEKKSFAVGEWKENAVQYEAKIGWRVLRATPERRNWWSLGDKIITDFREHWRGS
ncbi:hypothetical protein A3H90_03380 [Candidatus Peribacteria bacterium RIFCSPLOWO2_02_FULL_55_36]|nr:MAG: hypothetical protein A3H90_03380 [Candidatus Peribacteria bacterium RIFCSPLOWO2_02_FULL_55_36]